MDTGEGGRARTAGSGLASGVRLAGDAGDTRAAGSPAWPVISPSSRAGLVPDPLADALLDGAAKAYREMAADVSRAYPGWEVTWDPEGFRACDGRSAVGPVPSPEALRALIGAVQDAPPVPGMA